MPSKFKYKTRKTAEDTARRFFANTTADSISLEDAFRAWGRDVADIEGNKAWLSNKLTYLKYHDIVSPVYSYRNNRRVLDGLQLTLDGKRALGRIGKIDAQEEPKPHTNGQQSSSVSLSELVKMIAQFKKDNVDDYEITFDVKLKST